MYVFFMGKRVEEAAHTDCVKAQSNGVNELDYLYVATQQIGRRSKIEIWTFGRVLLVEYK